MIGRLQRKLVCVSIPAAEDMFPLNCEFRRTEFHG